LKNKTFNKKFAAILSFLVGAIVFIILLFFQIAILDKQKQTNKIETTEKYIYFQKDISNIIYSNINLLHGYTAFLSTQKDVSKESTTSFLNELLKDKMEYISNITIIKDTTIEMTYPSTGNESSIGVDLAKVDKQKEKILKVKQSLKPIFQGPVQLVQGGAGFIIRIPVKRSGKYWGQLSVVLDADRFLKVIKNIEKELKIEIAIVNIDDETNTHIYGNESIIDTSYSKFNYNIDLLNWMIYITPKRTNTDMIYSNIFIFVFSVLFSILAAIISWFYLKHFARIRYRADYDNLTGLYNRNYSLRHVPPLFEDAKKRNYKLGVMILDINKFKSINDNYGHNAGDIVLKDFSMKLKSILRDEEKVFRIGGDEFMIIFEGIKNHESLKVIENRIRESMRYTIIIDKNEVKVSTSIGSALFPDDGDTVHAVKDLADKNMYEDKP